MRDAAAVRLIERVGDLRCDIERLVDRQRTAPNALRDQLALDILHRDEHRVLMLDEVVGDGDVGRLEERRGLRFTKQPGAAVGVAAAVGRQELQRDLTPQSAILGHVDLAHAARTDPWADVILQNRGARQGRRRQLAVLPSIILSGRSVVAAGGYFVEAQQPHRRRTMLRTTRLILFGLPY